MLDRRYYAAGLLFYQSDPKTIPSYKSVCYMRTSGQLDLHVTPLLGLNPFDSYVLSLPPHTMLQSDSCHAVLGIAFSQSFTLLSHISCSGGVGAALHPPVLLLLMLPKICLAEFMLQLLLLLVDAAC